MTSTADSLTIDTLTQAKEQLNKFHEDNPEVSLAVGCHKLNWHFTTERKDSGISYAYSNVGLCIDCWPPDFFEVRNVGESVEKCTSLHEAIRVAEVFYNDLQR